MLFSNWPTKRRTQPLSGAAMQPLFFPSTTMPRRVPHPSCCVTGPALQRLLELLIRYGEERVRDRASGAAASEDGDSSRGGGGTRAFKVHPYPFHRETSRDAPP